MRFGQRVFLRPVEKSAGYWYKSLLQHQASTRTLIMTLPQSRRLDFSEIPILDVGPLVAGDDDPTLINALHRACADVGFLYVRNHGVSMALVETLKESAATFFAAPMAEKMKIAIDPRIQGYLPLGYRSYEGEDRAGTSHQEGFWIGHDRPLNNDALLDGPVQWPDGQPDLKRAMLPYFDAVESLAGALMRGFSLALGLDEHRFADFFKKPLTRLKVNHYPPQNTPTADNDIGVVPHSDSGGFTILWQDNCGGLEIQNKNGEWVGAPPLKETFVINLGNIMQIWSNGRFSSTPHRVINRSNRDRYSIPLFVNPSADIDIRPLIDFDSNHSTTFNYGTYQRDLWRRTFPVAKIPA